MSVTKDHCDCKELKCFCGLPLYAMDHLQLPCCVEGKYHVLCIQNQQQCPKCKQIFYEDIKEVIENAEIIVMKKYSMEQKLESRREKARKQLQESIDNLILRKFNLKNKKQQ